MTTKVQLDANGFTVRIIEYTSSDRVDRVIPPIDGFRRDVASVVLSGDKLSVDVMIVDREIER